MSDQYDIVQVRFPPSWRIYNYLAPRSWGLRVGDKVTTASAHGWATVVSFGPSSYQGPYRMLTEVMSRDVEVSFTIPREDAAALLSLVEMSPKRVLPGSVKMALERALSAALAA